MAKRTAAKELTDRNWDDEDEPEEAGQFVQASDDILKSRQIKKAKRRGAPGDEDGFNAFSGFSGFKSMSSTTTENTIFGGFENSNANSATTDSVTKSKNGSSDAKSESEFLANLKSLNESVIQWMQKHVGKNPYCILTPIFKDYETHLQELEKTKAAAAAAASSKSGFGASTSPATDTKTDSVEPSGSFKLSTNGTEGALSSSFTFGTKASLSSTTTSFGGTGANTEGFSFKSSLNPVSTFSMEAASSLSSTSAKSSTGPEAMTGGEDEEYVPPSVEVTEVQEDGAFYSKRCKLFSQKDGKWLERGVGNVHLKKSDAGKLQLIVRADTNLGNIILNIIMSDGIPVKKQGKNNVFFVSVPNPPFSSEVDDNPVPMLIRVKTSVDAEELVTKIEENRN